ncbi:MAG: DUF1905 domain-containing protein [Actinomycetes bacterium]
MIVTFSAEVFYWRGPSPFHFVAVPPDECVELQAISSIVTYGWGMIPVNVTVGETDFYTALFPKDGGYFVPLKAAIRKAEQIDVGDVVTLTLEVAPAS